MGKQRFRRESQAGCVFPLRKEQTPRGIEMQISSPLPVRAGPGRRLFRASHLGLLLPEGRTAPICQRGGRDSGSESLQGLHLLGRGLGLLCPFSREEGALPHLEGAPLVSLATILCLKILVPAPSPPHYRHLPKSKHNHTSPSGRCGWRGPAVAPVI